MLTGSPIAQFDEIWVIGPQFTGQSDRRERKRVGASLLNWGNRKPFFAI
jgi:hypothetical protein